MILLPGFTFSRTTKNKISKQGEYSGYSEAIYADNYNGSSQYMEMRDGTKLGIDSCIILVSDKWLEKRLKYLRHR